MFKYNMSYSINVVSLKSSVWDKFYEHCAL